MKCTKPVRILVQVTIHRRLRIGRDDHLDQSEAYDVRVDIQSGKMGIPGMNGLLVHANQ